MSTPLRKAPQARGEAGEQEIIRFEMQRIFKGEGGGPRQADGLPALPLR